MSVGTNTPPTIAATPVTALPPPLGVNGYSSLPAPTNGQQATEALYTNGVHQYQGIWIKENMFTDVYTLDNSIQFRNKSKGNSNFFIWKAFVIVSPPAQTPAAALDPLQQAYAGMQHYTGWCKDRLKGLPVKLLNVFTLCLLHRSEKISMNNHTWSAGRSMRCSVQSRGFVRIGRY